MFALVSPRGNSSLDDAQDIQDHPELQMRLRQGWRVKHVAVRLVEREGLKLLVVLHRRAAAPRRTRKRKPLGHFSSGPASVAPAVHLGVDPAVPG